MELLLPELSNLRRNFPTTLDCFQLKQELSNLTLSNLKPSNSTFFPTKLYNYTYPDFWYQNCETSSVRRSVEHQSLLDSTYRRDCFFKECSLKTNSSKLIGFESYKSHWNLLLKTNRTISKSCKSHQWNLFKAYWILLNNLSPNPFPMFLDNVKR